MKLRLLSLVLLGITLIDVTQARTIEKKEIDYDGAAKLVKMFEADDSNCKCLYGYCLARKFGQKEYTEVNGCGERKCYTNCDSSGCREVCDGQCKCERNFDMAILQCEECDDKGCKQVRHCRDTDYIVYATNCTDCNKDGCVKAKGDPYDCNRLCNDDVDDIVLQDKCVCKKDGYGKEICQMCGKYRCNPVADCTKFATCTLDDRDNTYRRCYGYKHGENHCRTMYSAVEFKKRDEEWEREFGKPPHQKVTSCECPSNGGDCKICDRYGYCRVGGTRPYTCSDSFAFNVTAHLH